MSIKGKIEVWLYIHGFKNGLIEVSHRGEDVGRVELPIHMVDRFHMEGKTGRGLFRVPEYLLTGLGVFTPRTEMPKTRPDVGISAGTRKPDDHESFRDNDGNYHLERHNPGHGILESGRVIRTEIDRLSRETPEL